jgi:hypothetical protein
LPAYFNDGNIIEQGNILLFGSTNSQTGTVYEDWREGPVQFNISISHPPNQTTRINILGSRTDVTVQDGSGVEITYLEFSPGNHHIEQTIQIQAIDDFHAEPNETITFTLSGATASHWDGGPPNQNTITVIVIDNDIIIQQ